MNRGIALKRGRAKVAAMLAAVSIEALIVAAPGAADSPGPPTAATPAASQAKDAPPATLLGDMGGLRPAIAPYGFTFGLIETSELLGNLSGGVRRGAIY